MADPRNWAKPLVSTADKLINAVIDKRPLGDYKVNDVHEHGKEWIQVYAPSHGPHFKPKEGKYVDDPVTFQKNDYYNKRSPAEEARDRAAQVHVNEPASSLWKAFPTYGNYGGPNWSAGEWGGNPLSSDAPPPYSEFDAAYKEHDIGYAKAKSVVDVRDADRVLAKDLIRHLADSRMWAKDPKGALYSTLALGAFTIKDLGHMLGFNFGTT